MTLRFPSSLRNRDKLVGELRREAVREVAEAEADRITGASETPQIDTAAIVSTAHCDRPGEREEEEEDGE